MSDEYFDREPRITIECEMCGNEFQHSVHWIHTHGSVQCPHCGCMLDRDACLPGTQGADRSTPTDTETPKSLDDYL